MPMLRTNVLTMACAEHEDWPCSVLHDRPCAGEILANGQVIEREIRLSKRLEQEIVIE